MRIVSEQEVIRLILATQNRYACYLGSGASAEARVPTAQAICEEIFVDLKKSVPALRSGDDRQIRKWKDDNLAWDKPDRRYMTCVQVGYPNEATRVDYFRSLLVGKSPSFCHYGQALLMGNYKNYLKRTCLTTNFDKLLEVAFARQGVECQAIRTPEESRYWKYDDRCYVVKLHGDYDTYNILNTIDETVKMQDDLLKIVQRLVDDSGLLVLGSAGYEKSIHTMFDVLAEPIANGNKNVLAFGLFWGVYMGQPKPAKLSELQLKRMVTRRLEDGVVSKQIQDMMERVESKNALFCFFPVWGAGSFMLDLISATNDKSLIGTAQLYLDHDMRLRRVFSLAGLDQAAIEQHIQKLRDQRRFLDQNAGLRTVSPETPWRASDGNIEVRIVYGDIASRSLLNDQDFVNDRRAVISPEDTCISAGGGVAFNLLTKAGPEYILNEVAKFSPIDHCSVAVTSAGRLPTHYIFHTAALKIKQDGSYEVSKKSVFDSVIAVLDKAAALKVTALWIPLLGAGVASVPAEESLRGILEAIRDWRLPAAVTRLVVMVVIYGDKSLDRHTAAACLQQTLGAKFTIQQTLESRDGSA